MNRIGKLTDALNKAYPDAQFTEAAVVHYHVLGLVHELIEQVDYGEVVRLIISTEPFEVGYLAYLEDLTENAFNLLVEDTIRDWVGED